MNARKFTGLDLKNDRGYMAFLSFLIVIAMLGGSATSKKYLVEFGGILT